MNEKHGAADGDHAEENEENEENEEEQQEDETDDFLFNNKLQFNTVFCVKWLILTI